MTVLAARAYEEPRVSPEDIRTAREALRGAIIRTPAVEAPKLSALSGAQIFIKYENMQATGSFKERGALNKLLSLDAAQRERGVIAISAGNHAQAVAHHAARLGIPATIVMPEGTPFNKVGATEAFGAKVILYGESVAESRVAADRLIVDHGFTLVHPYDDPAVIAGQGTAALEFLEDCSDLDCLIVPIGGGGFISGVAIAAKALKPGIEIIGVEVESYPSTYAALRGRIAECGGATLAEGIAVKTPGAHTLPVMRDLVTDVVLVSESMVESAIFLLASLQKTVAEGASAAALAAVLSDRRRFHGRRIGLFQSGANIDSRVLAAIIIRGLERESKILSLRIQVDDRPGMLGELASELGRCGANILEVHHRRFYLYVPAKSTLVDIVIETKDARHAEEIIGKLRTHGFRVERLNASGGESASRME